MLQKVLNLIPVNTRETIMLRLFGRFQVRGIGFISPTVIESTPERMAIRVPLNRKTKNHLNGMYFGCLAAGADCAGGLIAYKTIQERKAKVQLIFKDFQAEFLKRAEGDVVFSCDQGRELRAAVDETIRTGERVNPVVHVIATVPSKFGNEPVAKFKLTLSLKRR